MPRARINDTEEEVVLPKTRTRKPRVVSDTEEPVKVVRKRVAPRPRATADPEPIYRKAPTPLSAQRKSRSKKSKTLAGVFGMCLLLSGVGIGIGFMDRGEIDVVAVVNERNEKINKGEIRDEAGQVITQTIQVQNPDSRPNGGLKIGDAPATVPLPVEATTTNATTTPEETDAASSTEAVPESEVENEIEPPV
ncbi:MAG: hypothetical protein V4606_01860 [Patescibacteria group bacterium]